MSQLLNQLQPGLLKQFQAILAQGRLSHAYLFSGNFGSLDLAIYLAQSRFCEDLSDQNLPCQTCRACRLVEAGDFADVTMVEPSGQLIKTDQIRSLVKDFAQSGYEGACQVFIIKEADKMHPNAANSLLKQIEEPTSPYYVFLLTSDENKVLPTIKSRCQVYRFVTDRGYLEQAFERTGLLKSQARVLAQLTDDPNQIEELVVNKRLLDLIGLAQTFVKHWRQDLDAAYLFAGRLVSQATEKAYQDLFWQVLTLEVATDLHDLRSSAMLQKIGDTRAMWQANVSFHNCLDYLIVSLEGGR